MLKLKIVCFGKIFKYCLTKRIKDNNLQNGPTVNRKFEKHVELETQLKLKGLWKYISGNNAGVNASDQEKFR